MFNVFEEALPRSGAEIGSIRGALLDGGALGAVMTGTGSAVFGVFDDRRRGCRCERQPFAKLQGVLSCPCRGRADIVKILTNSLSVLCYNRNRGDLPC